MNEFSKKILIFSAIAAMAAPALPALAQTQRVSLVNTSGCTGTGGVSLCQVCFPERIVTVTEKVITLQRGAFFGRTTSSYTVNPSLYSVFWINLPWGRPAEGVWNSLSYLQNPMYRYVFRYWPGRNQIAPGLTIGRAIDEGITAFRVDTRQRSVNIGRVSHCASAGAGGCTPAGRRDSFSDTFINFVIPPGKRATGGNITIIGGESVRCYLNGRQIAGFDSSNNCGLVGNYNIPAAAFHAAGLNNQLVCKVEPFGFQDFGTGFRLSGFFYDTQDLAPPPDAAVAPAVAITGQGCGFVELTLSGGQYDEYDVLRDGSVIASGRSASQKTYRDTGLASHTNYSYSVVVRRGAQSAQSSAAGGYTRCVPACNFNADKTKITEGQSVNLAWSCENASGCSISTVGSVSSAGGTAKVSPKEGTTYVLSCQNPDGSVNIPQSIEVEEKKDPGLKEVIP